MRTSPPELRAAARTASRLLAIGGVALLGAAAIHGAPSATAVRCGVCAVAGCAAPTAAAPADLVAAGRAEPDTAGSRHP